ncbi:anti-sigma factor [Bacteroidia bacterium]|nr:anti-sigma factor [Bacteroidia bacterium]
MYSNKKTVNTTNDIEIIIARHLGGMATETEALHEWLAASEQNRAFFAMLVSFRSSRSPGSSRQVNTEKAWEEVRRKTLHQKTSHRKTLHHPQEGETATRKKGYWSHFRYAVAAAATVVLLLTLSWWLNYELPQEAVLLAESGTSVSNIILADSSRVCLNRSSKLISEPAHRHGTREFRLEGEAFFEVAPPTTTESGNFTIFANETQIKDIGTQFNVEAYPQSDSVVVYVSQGEVQFFTMNDAGMTLRAGETGIYRRSDKVFLRTETDVNATSYKTRTLIFMDTPLEEALNRLNEMYDTQVSFYPQSFDKSFDSGGRPEQRISVTFHDESIETILSILCETLDLKVQSKMSEDGQIYVLVTK